VLVLVPGSVPDVGMGGNPGGGGVPVSIVANMAARAGRSTVGGGMKGGSKSIWQGLIVTDQRRDYIGLH